MTGPAIPKYEPEGNPLLADLLARYPLHRVSDFCSIILERHGAGPQPRANPEDVRRQPEGKRGRRDTPPADAHGCLSTYVNSKCRCVPCSEARSAYDRERKRKRREAAVCPSERFLELGACTTAGNRHSALQPVISHPPTRQPDTGGTE